MTPEPLPRQPGSVLVRCSPEILERIKTGDVEPVVIIGVQELEDGTHDMTLMTPDIVYENRKLREALREVANHPDIRPILESTARDLNALIASHDAS